MLIWFVNCVMFDCLRATCCFGCCFGYCLLLVLLVCGLRCVGCLLMTCFVYAA